ncbi:sigma-B regulation protein RsbU (phosphoserine phosphatase) [Nitrospirillum bahiense]|uniref:Sigma-B regulation protein RsbU (Phosphoserine phosphatase) n=1 Tax=Nitrospirillum amazonense TaxID=28077 RepID=A0A560FJF9_9PROT|nr:sigma-B regulation protein RsbU (phosphoserine phosphatase) [Nitrospirillum amazonense]
MPETPRVLIVDDDPVMRDLVSVITMAQGFEVLQASDGAEGLSIIRNAPRIDLVISDWEMPFMDGVEFCRQIRALHMPKYIHVLLLTARQRQADFLAAMEAGADDFLSKPFNPAMLSARLGVTKRLLALQSRLMQNNELLTRTNERLTETYTKLQEDMDAAARAQRRLLPEPLKTMGRAHFASCLVPSADISGDMYNFFELPDGSIGFYMVDVAGHGARAALMSVTLNRLLNADAFVNGDGRQHHGRPHAPHSVVSELNRRFVPDSEIVDYFTMICGVLDQDTGQLRFCQAGHPHPVVVPRNGAPYAVGSGGFPVGLLDGMDYDDTIVSLAPGTRVVLHSDGVTECASPDGEFYGEARLHKLLHEVRELPIDQVSDAVREDLYAWRGGTGFDDDVSVLAFEIHS